MTETGSGQEKVNEPNQSMTESFNTGKHFLSIIDSSQRSGLQIKISMNYRCLLLCEILKVFTKSLKICRTPLMLFPTGS